LIEFFGKVRDLLRLFAGELIYCFHDSNIA
jgi:hypothetical protein